MENSFRLAAFRIQPSASAPVTSFSFREEHLAEGSGRSSKLEQKRFFDIAFGSLRECQAILDLAISPMQSMVKLADNLAAHLYKLIQVVSSSINR